MALEIKNVTDNTGTFRDKAIMVYPPHLCSITNLTETKVKIKITPKVYATKEAMYAGYDNVRIKKPNSLEYIEPFYVVEAALSAGANLPEMIDQFMYSQMIAVFPEADISIIQL